MKSILTDLGIPTASLAKAYDHLDVADGVPSKLLGRLSLVIKSEDAFDAARLAVRAIMAGDHMTMERVRAYVLKELVPSTPVSTRIFIQAVVLETPDVVVTTTAPDQFPVRVRKGRTRTGNSDFALTVPLIEQCKGLARATIIDRIMTERKIGKSSANVYLWRYNKGERA